MNRISAGRLYQIARAMQVDVSFFFEGLAEAPTDHRPGQDRMMLDLSRNFIRISDAAQQAALCHFAPCAGSYRTCAEPKLGDALPIVKGCGWAVRIATP